MLRHAWAGCLLASLFLIGACGGPASTAVKGKVAFKGQPVSRGTVIFFGEDGRQESANLVMDGTYFVPQAPSGKVKVAVQVPTHLLQGKGKAPTGGKKESSEGEPIREEMLPPGYVAPPAIPKRYYDPETSGLEYTVSGGSQTINIDLKP